MDVSWAVFFSFFFFFSLELMLSQISITLNQYSVKQRFAPIFIDSKQDKCAFRDRAFFNTDTNDT